MAGSERGFEEVEVTNFSSQSKKQRFPHLNSQNEPLGFPDFEEDTVVADIEDGQPPRIAEWRSNLAALSQQENLYFAAYENKIHVTIPRDLKQMLPGNPDLVLDLPISENAMRVGGYIDIARPHCINNIMVGNLGTHEILLMCCDDGDVLAYYTRTISSLVQCKDPGNAVVMPFFHENVGMSAWGLAIHPKSRVVAVSSNLRQVTVFIPAITWKEGDVREVLQQTSYQEAPETYQQSPYYRTRNTRRILKLGVEGHNIPSVDFVSDHDGEATSVLAIDILGSVWILGIWSNQKQRIQGLHTRDADDDRMGWGVISVPLSAFRSTATPQECLGMIDIYRSFAADKLEEKNQIYFDISSSIRTVKDNNMRAVALRSSATDRTLTSALVPEYDNDNLAGPLDSVNSATESTTGEVFSREPDEYWSRFEDDPEPTTEERGEATFLAMLTQEEGWRFSGGRPGYRRASSRYIPDPLKGTAVDRRKYATECFRQIVQLPAAIADSIDSSTALTKLLEHYLELKAEGVSFETAIQDSIEKESPAFLLPDKSAIIRTYQFDMELIPPTEHMPKTICRKIVKQSRPAALELLAPFERLSFLKLIPELSLLILGSQSGRAALVTLTRPDVLSNNGPVVNFRLDLILPRKSEEEEGLRPLSFPLFGLAVAPVQQAKETPTRRRESGTRRASMSEKPSSNRWRLILHYYDHTVLSYELSRDSETSDLLVL